MPSQDLRPSLISKRAALGGSPWLKYGTNTGGTLSKWGEWGSRDWELELPSAGMEDAFCVPERRDYPDSKEVREQGA